jgi:predicted RNase H-like nuclease (RuvC/YqgF family)
LSWVEILGIFIGLLGLVLSVWLGFKSVSDAEQSSIRDVKKDLISLIENIKHDKEATDRSQNKDLEFVKQQTSLLSGIIQEQNRINAEISSMARDFEQLSAALAQNSKYTEVLKRQSNIERRVEKLENANH